MMGHTYNPNYSGGRDFEDHGSKASTGKKLAKPYPNQKRWVWWPAPTMPTGQQDKQEGHSPCQPTE
jgi:hypothetical protein